MDPQLAEGVPCDEEGDSCEFLLCKAPAYDQDLRLTCEGGRWKVEAIGSSCNPTELCPSTQPVDGSSCGSPEGTTCTYDATECCPGDQSLCVEGVWRNSITVCNPPPPEPCPAAPPAIGTSCAPADRCAFVYRECAYGDCAGKSARIFACDESTQQWQQTAACSPDGS